MKRLIILLSVLFVVVVAQPVFANHLAASGTAGGDVDCNTLDCVFLEFDMSVLNPNINPLNPPQYCDKLPTVVVPIVPALADTEDADVYIITHVCVGGEDHETDGEDHNGGGSGGRGVSADAPGADNNQGASHTVGNHGGNSADHRPENPGSNGNRP